jgi:hypothetical protein
LQFFDNKQQLFADNRVVEKIFGCLKGENGMRKNKKLLVISAILISCAIASWFAVSTQGQGKVYEVHPQIAYPYGYTNITDNSRLIDLIEHLSYQNQQLVQNQAAAIAVNTKELNKKLDFINKKLKDISNRMARIEKSLNIKKRKKGPEPLGKKNPSQ